MTGNLIPLTLFFSINIILYNFKLNLLNTLLKGNHRVPDKAENQKDKEENRNKNTDINKNADFGRKLKKMQKKMDMPLMMLKNVKKTGKISLINLMARTFISVKI